MEEDVCGVLPPARRSDAFRPRLAKIAPPWSEEAEQRRKERQKSSAVVEEVGAEKKRAPPRLAEQPSNITSASPALRRDREAEEEVEEKEITAPLSVGRETFTKRECSIEREAETVKKRSERDRVEVDSGANGETETRLRCR